MSLQVCPDTLTLRRNGGPSVGSACHVLDARADHRCLVDEDCGTDLTTCRKRTCSLAGYCGLWLFVV